MSAFFQYAEEARARALIELLEESRASIHLTATLEADWAKKERALQVGLADVQRQLEKEQQAARLQALEKRRDDLYHDYENLIGELRRRHPRYAELKYPEPVTIEQCQAGLDGETVLLEYLLGEKSSLLFAVSREGYAVFKLPRRTILEGKVKTLKQTFTAEGMTDPRVQSVYVEEAGTLYDRLIKPAESMLIGKKEFWSCRTVR